MKPVKIGCVARKSSGAFVRWWVESALAHWTDWDYVVIELQSNRRVADRSRGGQLRSQQRGWLGNVLARHGQVVVEPWLDKVLDLSALTSMARCAGRVDALFYRSAWTMRRNLCRPDGSRSGR